MTETDEARAVRMNRNSDAIEDLVAANSASSQVMKDLVEHVRRESETQDRKIVALERNHRQLQLLTYIVSSAMVILLALAVINAFNIAAAKDQQRQVAQINRTLLDCVNSTGECGRVNTATQAQILDTVKQYELTGFYCIRTNPVTTDPKGESFLKCMERLYPGGPTLNGK